MNCEARNRRSGLSANDPFLPLAATAANAASIRRDIGANSQPRASTGSDVSGASDVSKPRVRSIRPGGSKMRILTNVDVNSITTKRPLNFLWLELTQKCNLTCQHCYVSSGPSLPLHSKMTHTDWLAAIDEAADLGCEAIQFIGGEPMLYPKLDELIERSRARSFSLIEVFTNGTAVNDKRATFFAKFGVKVACSFYSADSKTHDTVTGKTGSFDLTLGGLRNLARHSVPVRIGFIEMPENEGHFGDARSLLASIGIDAVRHDGSRALGRGEAIAMQSTSSSKFDGLCGQCSKGRLCVTYSGKISPCPMSREFPVGDFFEGGLTATLTNEPLGLFQDEMDAETFSGMDCNPKAGTPCGPVGDVPCMVCGPGNCHPDFACGPDGVPGKCLPGLCIP